MNQVKAELVPRGDLRLILFKGQGVRQKFHNGEWLFSIIDIIKVLTESKQPGRYWNKLKSQLVGREGFSELFANSEKLKFPSSDGKMYGTEVVNTTTLLRIIQSIQSKNAEPCKKWLAPKEATR